MKQIFFLVCFMACATAFSQGILKGTITDENGETAIGATVMIKATTIGVTTDIDGNYSLTINDDAPKTLVVSYISFKTIETPIRISNNETVVKNFVLTPDSKVLGEVEVVGKASKAKEYYMEKIKMNSAATLDYISSETMKKTGDGNVAAATARVSGVATNSGGLITVRGIGDRYVKTTMNGARIPTLDPLTNNIKLDLFPASLVDNIIITKTASADLPGDWAGAYISVETKDYPDQFQLNVETTVGYNAQSTFKNVLTSQRSSTDWLGYDNGFREYNHKNYPGDEGATSNIDDFMTKYQQFIAIGLGDYLKSLGITSFEIWQSNQDLFFKLGLIKLGLLPPALINDKEAYHSATLAYAAKGYYQKAFQIHYAKTAESGKTFSNNWNLFMRKAPLNFSQSFSIGNQTKFLGRYLGVIAGFRYNSAMVYDANSIMNRVDGIINNKVALQGETNEQKISKETNGWSALINLAYKLNTNNSVSLLFMPNLTGVNNVRDYQLYNYLNTANPFPVINYGKDQFYESRKQLVYQLNSDHYLPQSKIKIAYNASYTNASSKVPDFKYMRYRDNAFGVGPQIGADNGPVQRLYRYLKENILETRLMAELPIGHAKKSVDLENKIRVGAAYQYNYRKSDAYSYSFFTNYSNSSAPFDHNNITDYFSLDQFEMYDYIDANGNPNTTIGKYYAKDDNPSNHSFGKSNVKAVFAMLDYSIIPSLRVSGGLRVEQFNAHTDFDKFDSMNYENNDLRRKVYSFIINSSKINQTNFLPSVNLIYKLKKDENAPVNIRFNYSQTLARPSLRELSDGIAFDYEFNMNIKGNSELKTVKINNYDARLEWYFKSADNLSFSIFYKDFINHIQMNMGNPSTWVNSIGKSYVQGIEIEGKKNITKNLEFRANLTLVKSSSYTCSYSLKQDPNNSTILILTPTDTLQLPMFGQAPYIINSMLSYTFDSLGLGITASYNVQGPRLVMVANVEGNPDVYEMPRHLMDLKISKTLGKHFGISFKVKDVLNTRITRTYKLNNKWMDYDFDSYRFGSIYELGISYKI